MTFQKVRISIGGLGFVVGCAGPGPAPDSADPAEDPTREVTSQTHQELSNVAACATDPAEALILRHGVSSSPASYGGGTCTAANLVDLVNYVGGVGCQMPQCAHPIAVSWDAALPETQADCEAAQVAAYVWDKTASPPVYKGAVRAIGTWNASTARCSGPILYIDQTAIGALTAGHSYRFAVSARQGTSAANTRRVVTWAF